MPSPTHHPQAKAGLVFALSAYLMWGLVPLYYKIPSMMRVPPIQVLAHRIVWSVVMLAMMVTAHRGWAELRAAARSRAVLLALIGSTLLIALNWFVFIWAMVSNRVLQASLGYFMNPLINVALGMLFLRERMRAWQGVAIALAATGVAVLTMQTAELPWMAITMGTSFGFYGLIRKTAKVGPLIGLTIETALLGPLALAAVAWWSWHDLVLAQSATSLDLATYALLTLAGPVTVIPLLLFTHGARRLRLSTMGFLQYVAPTCQFLLAVLVYGEELEPARQAAFALVWAGLAVYMIDAYRAYRDIAGGEAAPAPTTPPAAASGTAIPEP